MLSTRRRALSISTALLAGLAGVSTTSAAMNVDGEQVVVYASNGQTTRMIQFSAPSSGAFGNGLSQLNSTMSITGPAGEHWADVNVEYASLNGSLVVSFNVVNETDSDMMFAINKFTSFTAVNGAQARASGSVTLTDGNGDGAMLTGLHAGGDVWRWDYNTPGEGLDGTLFDTQVTGPISVGEFNSVTQSESRPPAGLENLGTNVSSLGVQIRFTLSGNDVASGTGVFAVVIPTPGAATLAGLALFPLVSRRRR